MAGNIKVGHFEADGALIYLPLGFKPDFFLMMDYSATPLFYYFWGEMESHEAANSEEGVSDSAGTKAKLATDGGFASYDTATDGPTIAAWAASTAYTARTATARGSLVRRSASTDTDTNGLIVDINAIFECVTAGTSGSSVPTWPAAPGAQSASDNGVIWEKAEDIPHYRMGYQGIRIAAALMTDGQEIYYLAINAEGNVTDWGDVVSWPSGVFDDTL